MKSFWEDIGDKSKRFLQLGLAFVSILFIFYLLPKSNTTNFSYELGKPWQYEELYSPFDFAILKPSETFLANKKDVEAKHLKHYIRLENDTSAFSKYQNLFKARLSQLDSVQKINFNQEETYQQGFVLLEKLLDQGIIDSKNQSEIALVQNNTAVKKASQSFLTLEDAKNHIEANDFGNDETNRFLKSILKISIAENIIFDQKLTNKLLEQKLSEVSQTNGLVKKGEKIIGKGEIVDEVSFQKLVSYNKKYAEQTLDNKQTRAISIGYFILIALIIGVLVLYLILYQTYIFSRFRKFSLIFLLINASILLTAIFSRNNPNFVYLIPFTIVPIVMRAFFKRETALYVHIAIVLIAGLMLSNSFHFIFIQIIAGITAIYGNKNVRYWSQFFKAIGFIFVAYLLAYVGVFLIENGGLQTKMLTIIGFLALNVFLSFLAYPLIVFFEKVFGLLSDISLVEYTDLNKPLLKKLSIEAPGTFQHSLQVANLAEAAASEIKANSLLVKVGALYHDIGKMKHKIYFIENQFPEQNPHEKLSYEESAKIIIAHVTDGVKLAKKNGLPEQIIEFIKTHHGTTRVEYFYRMHAKIHPDEIIDDKVFCYPGPAPFKKEHAILMMADSVEAASKSLKNPTHQSLNDLVDKIIDFQKERGQFDNVPITFAEISRCKEVFKKMLASIYHIRIEYPKE